MSPEPTIGFLEQPRLKFIDEIPTMLLWTEGNPDDPDIVLDLGGYAHRVYIELDNGEKVQIYDDGAPLDLDDMGGGRDYCCTDFEVASEKIELAFCYHEAGQIGSAHKELMDAVRIFDLKPDCAAK